MRFPNCDWVRIESPGENANVHRRLLEIGGFHQAVEYGELVGLQANFVGFESIMKWLGQRNWNFQNHPLEMLGMFDKWDSNQRFQAESLNRPKTILAPETYIELVRAINACFPKGRVFLKPRYSSSSSGVCAFHCTPRRQLLIAPIEIEYNSDSFRLFNSLRVRTYSEPETIEAVLNRLLPEHYICEAWIPKARSESGRVDLRILVIDGDARHWVVRESDSPMTNLHLGNRRGCRESFARNFGPQLSAALDLAAAAGQCFPKCHYAGVDIVIDRMGKAYVCEINACGDLLPGILDRGETTYEACLRSLLQLHNRKPTKTPRA